MDKYTRDKVLWLKVTPWQSPKLSAKFTTQKHTSSEWRRELCRRDDVMDANSQCSGSKLCEGGDWKDDATEETRCDNLDAKIGGYCGSE